MTLSLLASVPVREEEQFVTELRHLPEGWPALLSLGLVLALCAAVVWMYRHEGRAGATLRTRMMLALVRCAIIVTLAVIVLEPVRVRVVRRWVDSYVVALVDDSSSMDLADRYREPSNADRVGRALGTIPDHPLRRKEIVSRVLRRGDRKFLRDLAERNRVKLYTFSDEPRLLGTIGRAGENRQAASEQPDALQRLWGVRDVPTTFAATGPLTDIERAIRRAVESLGSAPVSGVVVLSDGGFNHGATAEEVAGFARERGFPIHCVGIGDPSSPRNLRVAEILAPQNVFKQDPFAITVRLAAQGLDGETIRLEFRERDAMSGGEGRLLETRAITVGPGGAIAPVTFQRSQPQTGRFIYTVDAPVLEFETVADDNGKQATVNVIDSRTRVLIIAGAPSWDYRFVSRLLERDESIDVSCWLQSADVSAVRDGNTVIDHLPRLPEELFEYEVIILMDPDPAELDEPWCRLVDTLVTEYGGGLLLTAARARTPSFMRAESLAPLRALLPVTPDPDVDLILNQIGFYQSTGAPVEIPEAAYGHPILQLADDPVSTRIAWQGIGDVHWHYPVLRAKPAATVLMRDGDPRMRNAYGGHVLAAIQFVGAGRSGFIGFDGTWRWRKYGTEIFDRFWVQFVRYISEGKLLAGTHRGMLLTDRDQFSIGETVPVTARLLNERYEPLTKDECDAHYRAEGQQGTFALRAQPRRAGWFEGQFVPDRSGAYHLSVTLGAPDDPVDITREIRVSRPNIEILNPQMDRARLEVLSENSAGGRYFEVDELDQLAAMVPDLHEEVAIRSRPVTLWDRWTTLVWLVGLLSLEWAVRKLYHLL